MKKRKIIAVGLVLLILLQLLTGCASYHAKLFDSAAEWIDEDFVQSNIVVLVDSDNEGYPHDRTFIVKTQEEYDRIFNKDISELTIDFESQMLVIYTFVDIYKRDIRLKTLSVEENTLEIEYQMEKKYFVGDACKPYQRWFVVRLDKLDVDAAVFEESR